MQLKNIYFYWMPKIPPNDIHKMNLNISNCQNRYRQRSIPPTPAWRARMLITTEMWESADAESQFSLEVMTPQNMGKMQYCDVWHSQEAPPLWCSGYSEHSSVALGDSLFLGAFWGQTNNSFGGSPGEWSCFSKGDTGAGKTKVILHAKF